MAEHDVAERQLAQSASLARGAQNNHRNVLRATDGESGGISCRLGDSSCATAHASSVRRSIAGGDSAAHQSLMRMQRQYGNQFVGHVLRQTDGGGETIGMDGIERSIEQARGSGQGMDHGTRTRMEGAFGADFSGVRIHTDSRADGLSQSLSARAFATGHDVFFRSGEYNPGSSTGRELLAHELTHVVQQTGDGIQRKMTVSDPGDPHEVEADVMARAVMQQEHSPSSNGEQLSHQEDEEKPVAMKHTGSLLLRQTDVSKLSDEEEKR